MPFTKVASPRRRAGWGGDKVEVNFVLEVLSLRGHRTPERRKVREPIRWIYVERRS